MPEQKTTAAEPRTHLAYAAGKGTQVSISGYGVATVDRPCEIPASVAAELAKNRKLRIERRPEPKPPKAGAPTPAPAAAPKKGDA